MRRAYTKEIPDTTRRSMNEHIDRKTGPWRRVVPTQRRRSIQKESTQNNSCVQQKQCPHAKQTPGHEHNSHTNKGINAKTKQRAQIQSMH